MMKVSQMRQSGQKVRGLDMHAVDPPGLNFFLNLHAGFVFSGFKSRSSVGSKTDQNCSSKLSHCKLH